MQLSRLLHRQTKSESDILALLSQSSSPPVFVPLKLHSFDSQELCDPADAAHMPTLPATDKLSARITELKTQLGLLEDERADLEQDLADYRSDLLHARTELYSEMLRSARHQQRGFGDFRAIQKLEARHQRFCALLVDVGIPRTTVDVICQVVESGHGSAGNILVDAIREASKDDGTLLARLKPIIVDERTPEHYQSALNLALGIRKELKSQKKRTRFWKALAQENERHANTITPSPSDMSSIRQDISPERQRAVDELIARRRAVRYPENAEGDVFGGRRGESVLDTLASSLASRPRRSVPDDLRLSSSFSSSASSASTHLSYISAISRIPRDPAIETPTITSRLPSNLSTSLRRSSRSSSQSVVLGSVDLNISRSSPVDPTLPEETEQEAETGPASTVTLSQDLLQNDRRASLGHGHRRTASRRSAPTRLNRSSFRLSAFSPIEVGPMEALTADSNTSANAAVDLPLFDTLDVLLRLSDLTAGGNTDTPTPSEAPSEDTPFNDARVLPKYDATPFFATDLDTRDDMRSRARNPLCTMEHSDSSVSMATSSSTCASEASHARAHATRLPGGREHGVGTIPLGESNDSLFTTSASASATSSITANDTPAPTTPPTPSPSPIPISIPSPGLTTPSPPRTTGGFASVKRSMLPVLAKHLRRLSFSGPHRNGEGFVGRLRGLRSKSQPRLRSAGSPGSPLSSGGQGRSPARSESGRSERWTASASANSSPSPSPVKSGIPVLHRRMTIRARRASVKKV